MKKLLALILALTMVFALAACGSEPAANSDAPSGDDVPSGEAVELTLTCNGTDQGNDTRSAKRFKELIEEETNGRITINIINNDQLAGGNMTSAIELLTGGGTDIDIHSTSIISSIAPEAMVCTMPWLFSDYQAAEDAFFGAGGEYMTELLSTKGVTYLGAVHNGFKLITNSKHPIEQPEDLAGLKIRIPGGDFFMDFYTAYGASPQAMSWSEVFTALQQGTIDGHDAGHHRRPRQLHLHHRLQQRPGDPALHDRLPPHLRGLHLDGQHRQLHQQAERRGSAARVRSRRAGLQGGQR